MRVMRMGADRTEHVVESLGDRQQVRQPAHPGRDRHHPPDAGCPRARHDAVEIGGEVREIEVAMAVDQHPFKTQGRRFDHRAP